MELTPDLDVGAEHSAMAAGDPRTSIEVLSMVYEDLGRVTEVLASTSRDAGPVSVNTSPSIEDFGTKAMYPSPPPRTQAWASRI